MDFVYDLVEKLNNLDVIYKFLEYLYTNNANLSILGSFHPPSEL